MREILTGYGLLYVLLMALLFWATPSAANTPLFTADDTVNVPEATCQAWNDSWRADKAGLRTSMRQSIKNALDESEGIPEAWGLCLLMNVDYIVNTILAGCDAGVPLNVAFIATLQATGNRCSQ